MQPLCVQLCSGDRRPSLWVDQSIDHEGSIPLPPPRVKKEEMSEEEPPACLLVCLIRFIH